MRKSLFFFLFAFEFSKALLDQKVLHCLPVPAHLRGVVLTYEVEKTERGDVMNYQTAHQKEKQKNEEHAEACSLSTAASATHASTTPS